MAKPLAMEGCQKGTWVLIDCADLIVHVFDDDTRRFCGLERLWYRAPRVEVPGWRSPCLEPLPQRRCLSKRDSWIKVVLPEHLDRILTGKAGTTIGLCLSVCHVHHPCMAEIGEAIGLDIVVSHPRCDVRR